MNHEPRITNHGFTLIELITVIIIIGIMLGVALPKYMQLSEKTKASNAKQIMDMLRKAEEAYYIEASTYVAYANTDDYDDADIIGSGGIPHEKLKGDDDWDYGVVDPDSNTYTVTASRTGGSNLISGKLMSWVKDGSIRYCASAAGCATEDPDARKNWK